MDGLHSGTPKPSASDQLLQFLEAAACAGASDILLHEGRPIHIRVNGQLQPFQSTAQPLSLIAALSLACNAPAGSADFDGAILTTTGHRFRVNLFSSLGSQCAALRLIRHQIPEIESLGLPTHALKTWAASRSGLILVCGPSGSGKSTTLASLLAWMNSHMVRHVITIEDPVEFLFTDHLCLFSQREIGTDTPDFATGIRSALRQSPDVILVGEIRDRDTAEAALRAAETGHLILSTLHAPNVAASLDRLELLFPANERDSVRKNLSSKLLGILCQRLLPSLHGPLVPACEFCQNSGAVPNWIATGKHAELASHIEKSDGLEALHFNTSLAHLIQNRIVPMQAALAATSSPNDLQRTLRGVTSFHNTSLHAKPHPLTPPHTHHA